MDNSGGEASTVMLFERHDQRVCEAFRRGEFDYVEGRANCRRRTSSAPLREEGPGKTGGNLPFPCQET